MEAIIVLRTKKNGSMPKQTQLQSGYHNWKSLAQIYGVSKVTLKKRCSPILTKLKNKAKVISIKKKVNGKVVTEKSISYYFNYDQLKMIVSFIGNPTNYTFNGKIFIKDSYPS